MFVLSEDEKHIVRDALMMTAEKYVEMARSRLKFDGKPSKGNGGLVDYYFQKADLLSTISTRIK